MTASTNAVGRQIEVNGASLYVSEQGQGDPLVLVHMGLSSSASWDKVVPLLAEEFRVITYDTRGFGRSTNPTGVLSYEQTFVGGWSDGGETALHVGLRHPGRARALVCGGTSLELGSERSKAEVREVFGVAADGTVDFQVFAAAMEDRLLPLMRQWHPRGEAQLRAIVQQSATMYLRYDGLSREQIERIAEPTLVILGDRDHFVSVEEAAQLFRCLPHAELAILPGTSHIRPVFDPATFVRAMKDFLQRH
ncbi:MAG: hypothetical protein K0Q71_1865 [Thermomicrobiales bacterium]|nr:hypothetical protein [Thermomicrobiales bacterium]